ncbi:nuclear pore complex protein Nup50-like [Arapaima gigas]
MIDAERIFLWIYARTGGFFSCEEGAVMAKRIADKELTDRNWDQEDEGEEAGTFSIASEDVLKNRPIKKAKRRNPAAEGESGGAFKAFKGFGPTAGGGPAVFSGFGNGATFKNLAALTNGNGSSAAPPSSSTLGAAPATKSSTSCLTFNGPTSAQPPAPDAGEKQPNGSAPSPAQSPSSREYSRQLTALNYSVRDWITKHVNDNPLCDLNPIFRDYERHLASIEQKYGSGSESEPETGAQGTPPLTGAAAAASSSSSSSSSSGSGVAPSSGATLFSLTKEKENTDAKAGGSTPAPTPGAATFIFGKKVDSSALGSLPSFSFTSQSTSAPLFSSQGSAPASFLFGVAKGEAESGEAPKDENSGADEESEEPPKPVVVEVKEEDAFYSKKCKLFYKKNNEFKEKGVGTLHLKQVAEGKTQLLVRADTNLGNILLNILVHPSMPCSRTGKNNVMVVCVPNPPVDDKNPTTPLPLLIRVKTAEDADELHRILQEKKA